jgi:hypothetical protein
MANGGIIGPVKCISTPVTKVTSFTASGTFNRANCQSTTAPEILVVAGGGAGGRMVVAAVELVVIVPQHVFH